jgi:hypothetical protein
MRIFTHVLAILMGAAGMFFFIQQRTTSIPRDQAVLELIHTRSVIEKRLEESGEELVSTLRGFTQTVADNRDFAMKLIVEQDPSASEVSGIASRYIDVAGFSLLEVADSAATLVSCGHFPAATGTSASDKIALLDTQAVFLMDHIKGEPVLTRQARTEGTIADAARFDCMGGYIVDSSFVAGLAPREGVRLLFQHDGVSIGFDSVETMSEIDDNRMIVNDTTYLATSIDLPYRGEGEPPRLILLMNEPAELRLF